MGCDIHPYAEVRKNGQWEAAGELPRDRDYRTFALLADVRNYSTDPPIAPISPPRGLPPDSVVANTIRDEADHSFSWLTLAELEAADSSQTVVMQGMVSKDLRERYRDTGEPPSNWCQATNIEDYAHMTWRMPLKDVTYLLPKIIEAMRQLGPPDDVRMVFGFDN